MLRSLIYYRRVNLAVLLGAAVTTAVLAGALLVGDSVRGSLRDLALDRLGQIDQALLSTRFLREGLTDDLAARPGFAASYDAIAPAIVLRGSAIHDGSGTRASQVSILGVDERFLALYAGGPPVDLERRPGQIFPPAWINATLSRELGAATGDALLLRYSRRSDLPPDTLMGERDTEDVVGALRVTVAGELPDRGMGGFSLTPRQGTALDVFVPLGDLQRALGRRGEVNALFLSESAAGDGGAGPGALLAEALEFTDLGLDVQTDEGFVRVAGREFVLRPNVDDALVAVAAAIGEPLFRAQAYLANALSIGERVLPYSVVAAIDPPPDTPWARLTGTDGRPIGPIGDDAIVLGQWAADDLGAAPGDRLRLAYYAVGPREELIPSVREFTVAGVARMEGLAADATLTPAYPGIQDADDMSAWDPPFEVDLSLVREKDEAYWDRFGAAPKAFVSAATGRSLWGTRFGSTTSARVGAETAGPPATAELLRRGLLERMPPQAFDLEFRAVKRDAVDAAKGATDFSGLFIGFSFFLIVSATLIVGLLFALNVEQRAGQVGLLLAVGYPIRRVRRRLMAEGLALAALGGLVGLAGAVGYAGLMMLGLRTLWVDAVGSSALELHVHATSLVVGFVLALAIVGWAIHRVLKRLCRVPPPALLAGQVRLPATAGGRRFAPWLAWGGLAGAAVLVVAAFVSGATSSAGLAFGAGALLLVSGLAFFAVWCRGLSFGDGRLAGGLAGMAARSSAWNPGRSLLSAALVASACFVIVLVAVNRRGFGEELAEKTSGAGGYALTAESDVPLHRDLDRPAGRADLGLDEDVAALASARYVSFRLRPGDDTSCLNLYRPDEPRLLGVSPEFVERGGFGFREMLLPDDPAARARVEENPWRLLDHAPEPGVVPMIGDANSMQWIVKLQVGQDLELDDEHGLPLRLRLVATLDHSIFQSELLIPEAAFLEHFPGLSGYGFFLVEAPFAAAPEIAAALESGLSAYGFDATLSAEKLAAFQAVEHTYLSTFQLLGGLGLLLGTAGLGVVLLRNVIERKGELATLRAFGFRRRTLAVLVVAENAFLLLAGTAIGTVAALLSVAPRLLTIQVPWASLTATLALVVLVGMLSSIFAVLGALRTPLLPALKAER